MMINVGGAVGAVVAFDLLAGLAVVDVLLGAAFSDL